MSTSAPARYHQPSAIGGDLRRFASLTVTLAVTDFKLRFFGSVLGYVWTLMRPLLLFGVLYLVFTEVVRFGEGVKHYPVYLLAAIVLFTFFSETVVPLAIALHALFNLGLNLIVVFAFVLASGIEPRPSWLELIPLVALLVVLSTGAAMLLSALYVRYRDVQPIWEVVLQVLFYASPIIYVTETLPDSIEREALASPITAILTQVRHAVIDPDAPTAAQAMGGSARLLIPLGVIVVVFALGAWVFAREAPRIAEDL
jgi:ABC-2 type transport system permease protein